MKADTKSKMTQAMLRLFEDKQPLQIETSKMQMWQVLCTIQLACRHPRFKGPTRQAAESFAREIGAVLVANDSDLKMMFEMG